MSDVPLALAAALQGRYELHHELGRGGMATVYHARDRKHQRDVALKVLRTDLAASLGAERFLKEIEISARLVHPHILALHDSGEAEGFLYYVMPFIEGGSLRQALAQARRFDLSRALAVAGPVADALGYAHRMGVVHRDIKPENILFAQGHPVVADFGIAKAVSTAAEKELTRTGFPLGTPGYMSPEQAVGLTDLDARTDVYSLAVVVYEMLAGETPGHWPSEESVRMGRLREAPAPHRTVLDSLPRHVEGALARALTARSADRTSGVTALMTELNGEVAAPVAVVPAAFEVRPGARRRYSDGEVREIVRRAAEAEVNQPTVGALTIGSVEQIAAEAGIAVERVREAVRSLDIPRGASSVPVGPDGEQADPNPPLTRFIGERTALVFERLLEGELGDSDFPVLVEEIRVVMAQVGQVNQLGRSFSWNTIRTSGGTGRDVQVLVSVRGGKTRIQVRENLAGLIGGIYGGIGGGAGGGGLGPLIPFFVESLARPAALLLVIPAWLVTVFAISRSSYFYSVRRRRKKLLALIDRLESLAREMIG
jgi:tRNA A-37 threonylcarbamoyl transferase component Bud32